MKQNRGGNHILWFFVVVLFGLTSLPAYGAKFLSPGMTMPQFTLSEPLGTPEQTYLGLKDLQPFKLSQVPAKLILIEIFEVNCGICKEQAPLTNKLFNLIENNKELSRDIKMIGIGAGDDVQQLAVYKKANRVPFPLFTDRKFEIHKSVGRPGVPFHILIDRKGNVLLTELGLMDNVEDFFSEIMKIYEQQ